MASDVTIGNIPTAPVQGDTVFSYNQVVFGAAVKTKVTEEPVPSADGRMIKGSKFTIEVSGWITQADADGMVGATPGQALDALMLTIRRRLQVNGKELRYVSKGMGFDLIINGNPAVSQRDIAFGPRPSRFVWWPLGGADGAHGAGFTWSITFTIAECSRFTIAAAVFLEIAYTVTYDVGEDGLVSITYHGTCQIPMSLRLDGTLDRNVDSEITRIIRPTPVGFIRKHSRQLSADRATATFTITDRQQEVVPPMDTVHIDMRHRIKPSRASVFSPNWECSITGTVRLSPTANRFTAWRRFFSIAAQRMAFMVNHHPVRSTQSHRILGVSTRLWKPTLFVMGTEMDENLFSNESRFTVNYRIMGAPFDIIVQVSGLWRPIVDNPRYIPPGGSSWTAQTTANSLAGNAQKFKGIIGASFDNGGEVLVDICAGPFSSRNAIGRILGDYGEGGNAGADGEAKEDTDLQDIEPAMLTRGTAVGAPSAEDIIPAEFSWLAWECTVERSVDHRIIRHKPLSGVVKTARAPFDPMGKVDAVAKDAGVSTSGWTASVSDIVQQTASPSLKVRLTGFGVRVMHRVNPPKMISYGGRTAILQHEYTQESTLGATADVIMYRMDWVLDYLITGPTSTCPLPANPMLGLDGE